MKHLTLLAATAILLLAFSCNQSREETRTEEKAEEIEKTIPEEKEISVSHYCNVTNELRALLMENYWEKFKDKSYDEVKDIYAQYKNEEDEIYEKYGIDDPLELSNFFRYNYSEIEEYQKNNPDFKDYPEYQDAKMKLGSLAMEKAVE